MNPVSVQRKEIVGLHRITEKRLRELCKKDKLYQTPELNDVLYLHYQGFQYIECLDKYTELKCLWLECNAISEIEGLENQTKLKCLFLQNNLIKRIENLEPCRQLDTLNLASNHIRLIENCGVNILPVLNTLNLSSNYLRDSDSLRALEECKTLSVLDLANNRIDDILVVKVFAKMPQLRVLVLQGNPVVSKLPQYRKTLILECKELTYLDSRPVFPKDRACAEAWKRGGYTEERKEQGRWNRKERKKIRDSVNATIRMRNNHLPKEKQMELFTSSDSETDEKRERKDSDDRRNMTDPRLFMETEDDDGLLDIWDEVSDPTAAAVIKVSMEEDLENENKNIETSENNDEILENSKSSENLELEKLEAIESVSMANILQMVKNPIEEDEEMPKLITDAEIAMLNRKRPLIEEISVSSMPENDTLIREKPKKIGKVMKIEADTTESCRKQLAIEVVNSNMNTLSDYKEEKVEENKNTRLEFDSDKSSFRGVLVDSSNCELDEEKVDESNSILKDSVKKSTLIEEVDYNQQEDNNIEKNKTVSDEKIIIPEKASFIESTDLKQPATEIKIFEKDDTQNENCNWKKLLIEEINAEEMEYNQGNNIFLEFNRNHLLIETKNKKVDDTEDDIVKPVQKLNENRTSIEEIAFKNLKSNKTDESLDDETDSSSISSISFESSSAGQQSEEEMNDEEEKPSEVLQNEAMPLYSNALSELVQNTTENVTRFSSCESESEDEVAKQEYNATANAICDVVMRNLGSHEQSETERTVFMPLETVESNVENYEPELEIQKMLDHLPDDEIEVRTRRLETTHYSDNEIVHKTFEEIEYERKCEEVNRQVVKDFEELTHNMDMYIEELQQKQQTEERSSIERRMDQDNIYSDNGTIAIEFEVQAMRDCAGATVIGKQKQSDDIILVQRKADDDVQLNIVFQESDLDVGVEVVSTKTDAQQNQEQLHLKRAKDDIKLDIFYDSSQMEIRAEVVPIQQIDSQNFEYKEKFQENDVLEASELEVEAVSSEKSNSPQVCREQIDLERGTLEAPEEHAEVGALSLREFYFQHNLCGRLYKDQSDFERIQKDKQLDAAFEITNTEKVTKSKLTLSQNTATNETMEMEDFRAGGDSSAIVSVEEQALIDFNCRIDSPSIKAYEQESKDLRELLHKLEGQNEKLCLVKKACTELLHGNSDDEYYDAVDDIDEVHENTYMIKYVIKDIVTDVLDTKSQEEKPKNYQITDLESDEEYSYSEPPKPPEEPVKSIGNVLSSFNNFIRGIGRKNREERQQQLNAVKRVPTSDSQKAESLQTLIETPSLLEHHKDTYDSLRVQVEEVKQRQNEKLKKLVDRVYAQKDKYDDSLEFMDGRLVVIKKDSGEIEDVPMKKSPYGADSDEEKDSYTTAVSADEDENESVVAACSSKNIEKKHAWDFGMGAFVPHTWKPAYRPTMRKSAEQLIIDAINENNAAAEQSEDGEDENVASDNEPKLKQTGSIYSNIDEEFFKNLDFKKVAAESANDENFVDCARSYEELRQYLKPNFQETLECELTTDEKSIIEKLQSTDVENIKDLFKDQNVQEEDFLMKKLVERTKEAVERFDELTITEIGNESKQLDENGQRVDIYKCKDTVESCEDRKVSTANDVIYEMKPLERVQVKMLQELRISEAGTALASNEESKDSGDFTEPLGEQLDTLSLEEDIDFDAVHTAYSIQLNKWKQALKEKRAIVESTEVGTQCLFSDEYFLNENVGVRKSFVLSSEEVQANIELDSVESIEKSLDIGEINEEV